MGKEGFVVRTSALRALPDRVRGAAGLSRARAAPRVARSGPALRAGAPRVVLGIDPGTRAVGFGAVALSRAGAQLLDLGVLKPPAAAGVPERLAWIRAELDRLVARLDPDVVVVESAFAARNVRSALRIGEGRGVALACAAAHGAQVVEYPPAVAKKVLVGHGAASKGQVSRMLASLLHLSTPPEPLDASDALALALAHAGRLRLHQLRSRPR